jgi:predicted nucleotidyltransferase
LKLLDHYYLATTNNCFAVIVGNKHYQGIIIGYVKYCSTSETTPWCNRFQCYERIVKQYSAVNVYNSTWTRLYVPEYGGEVPVIYESAVTRILNPVERAFTLLNNPRDPLEKDAADLIGELYSTGITGGIGVTGSILAGIHNPVISDIDIIIYGSRESLKIIESITENSLHLEPFKDNKLREWCMRNANATRLKPSEVCKYYRVWRRGIFASRDYSILYNDGIPRRLGEENVWRNIGVATITADIEGGIEGLNYPSSSKVGKYIVEGAQHIPGSIEEILSFEALYIPILYEGGNARIRGLLQCNAEGKCRILVGVREEPGWIRWLGPLRS